MRSMDRRRPPFPPPTGPERRRRVLAALILPHPSSPSSLLGAVCIVFGCLVLLSYARKTRITLERMEIPFYDSQYGTLVGNIGKYNRTQFALNMSLTLTKDLPSNVKVYKFNDNQYKETAVQMTKNLCSFVNQEYYMVYGDLIRNGYLKTFVKSCPIKKGTYYFYNAFVPDSKFFNDLPLWRCRVDTTLTINRKMLGLVKTYVNFEEVY